MKEIKVGMFTVIRKDVESWHYVKIAKIMSTNGDSDDFLLLLALKFTGDGSCPISFKTDKSFVIERSKLYQNWNVYKTEAELLSAVL